jgi:UDP-N-acetylmuramoyl-tripeptide--D-alanyl-D-alanine ligase
MKVRFANNIPTVEEIAGLCGGRLIGDGSAKITSACTDSREAETGSLFVAIVGERVDGHNFLPSVASNGAACALCSRIPENAEIPIILVEDTVKALGRLGHEYSKNCKARRVGVTGSVGKTTTKEFIASVLSTAGKVWKTEGNFNSVIGLPMSLLTLPDDADFAVLEMGMTGPGEIKLLSDIACPEIGVITTIGTAHMELLGSRENIASAKLEIKSSLAEDGHLLLCGGEPLLANESVKDNRVSYFSTDDKNSDYFACKITADEAGMTFDASCKGEIIYDLEIPAIGKHNVAAALAGVAVGRMVGIDTERIRRGLAAYRPVGLRQQMAEIKGIKIISDCYNASPESMRAAAAVLSTVASHRNGKKVALLGDMLELGENSPALHYAVGEYFADAGIDIIVSFGERAEKIADGFASKRGEENVLRFPDRSDALSPAKALADLLSEGDVLILKASRMIAAERVAEELKKLL